MIHPKLPQDGTAVARHYDELDAIYREVWGEHVHHGLWRHGDESPEDAVEALVGLLAERLALRSGERVCDIGCGYGATARLLTQRHGVEVTGLTLSRAQHERAEAAKLPGQDFLLRDWLDNCLPPEAFDCAWSIESSEHMVDKQRFFDEAFRILRPGGRLAVYAWLARTGARGWEVDHLLEPICREGRLPGMGDEMEYRGLAEAAGFRVRSFEDLTRQVRRTWTICLQRVAFKLLSDGRYRRYLLDGGARERGFALSLMRILVAYRVGAMRYCLLVAEKPAISGAGSSSSP